MQLADHFTLEEMTVSQEAVRRGLSNTPNADQAGALRALCVYVLEPLRLAVGRPVVVLSGYRSAAVNAMVGGAKNSEHLEGKAADIIIPGMASTEVCNLVVKMNLPCRQIISEYGKWAHLSLTTDPLRKPELLTAVHDGRRTKYLPGLLA